MTSFSCRTTSVDPWSCTDGSCAWKQELKKVQAEIAEPVPMTEFCHHVTEKQNEVLSLPEIDNFFNSPVYRSIVESNNFI